MVKYKSAALALLLSAPTTSLHYSHPAFLSHRPPHQTKSPFNSRRYSAIPYDDAHSSSVDPTALQIVESSIDNLLPNSIGQDEQDETFLAKKEERIQARRINEKRRQKGPFRVTLPIVRAIPKGEDPSKKSEDSSQDMERLVAKGQEIALQNTVGMSLRQVTSGRRLSELALDVDTLRFQSFVDELQGRTVLEEDIEEEAEEGGGEDHLLLGSIQVLQNSALNELRESFDGVLVSSVARGGLAWEAGVRAGDVLVGTSATIGNKLWPKSTLDGVRSAISSRKVLSSTMEFEFRRLGSQVGDAAVDGVESFELNLSRPIGINVEGEDCSSTTNITHVEINTHLCSTTE
jgi:hypothetical protein